MEDEELTQKVIGAAITVHRRLGVGFVESVYQNALLIELRKLGLRVECAVSLKVHYDNAVIGEFQADMIVEERLLIENKVATAVVSAHEAQLINYLAATKIEIGLLLNFGTSRVEIRRKWRTYRPRDPQAPLRLQEECP